MKYFSFCKRMSGIHAVVLLGILISIGLFHFVVFNFQRDIVAKELKEYDNKHVEYEWADIESVIVLSRDMARAMATQTANSIVTTIIEEYNKDELKAELDKLGHNSPTLIEIITRNIRGKYMFGIHNRNNDIFVISRQGVIVDLNVSSIGSASRSFNEEAQTHYNGTLMYSALDSLLSHKDNVLIYYEPDDPKVEGHTMITSPTANALKEVFEREGLEGLKGYNILVPAYITDDGDVFGVPDVSPTGVKNQNHKIIVVQSFSIYDAMMTHNQIKGMKDAYFYHIRTEIVNAMQFTSLAYIAAMLMDIAAILFLLFYSTKTKEDEESLVAESQIDDDVHE